MRQGENLSPLLFAIYLNDFEFFVSRYYKGLDHLANEFNNVLSDDDVEMFLRLYVLLYADDTIVMSESHLELQKALSAVYDYCDMWKLIVNTSKTKIIIFSRGKVRNTPTFMFGDEQIEIVDDYVYLGTTFNFNGKFNKAIDKQVTQAKRAMYSMLTKAKQLSLPLDIQCELIDQLVLPILVYGCEVWGFQKLDQIEVFFRKFLKYILKLNKSTPNCMVLGEVARANIELIVEKRMLNFWVRVIDGKQSKLSNIMFRLLKKLHDQGSYLSKWTSKIKNILIKCGMPQMWNDYDNFNKKWIANSVNLRLSDISKQEWLHEVNTNRMCENYKYFKSDLVFEQLLLILSDKEKN